MAGGAITLFYRSMQILNSQLAVDIAVTFRAILRNRGFQQSREIGGVRLMAAQALAFFGWRVSRWHGQILTDICVTAAADYLRFGPHHIRFR
jgi:hypothetical protein